MKRESFNARTVDPPDWKEKLTKEVRKHLPRESQAEAIRIIEHPKTELALRKMMAALHPKPVDFMPDLIRCASIYSAPLEKLPTLWHDRDELHRQTKAAKTLQKRLENLIGSISRSPSDSSHLYHWSFSREEELNRPPMSDGTILWAMETIVDYLKRCDPSRKTRTADWRKDRFLLHLDDILRKANLKGKELAETIAALMEATFGKVLRADSIKPLTARAWSRLPTEERIKR